MNDQDVSAKIKQIISNIAGLDPQKIPDGSSLRDDLKLYSPALDINAYQYGATRTIRISVAPAATNSLMHQLQSFSSRNGFKTWRAGAPQTGDVALAIEA